MLQSRDMRTLGNGCRPGYTPMKLMQKAFKVEASQPEIPNNTLSQKNLKIRKKEREREIGCPATLV